MIKKSLGIYFFLGAFSFVFACESDLIVEKDLPEPPLRQFYPMSLDIFHVTTPDIEKLQPYKTQIPGNERDAKMFKTLISFMSQFVFLQKEGVLWGDDFLYPEVVLTTTDLIVSKAHAPYEIRLTDIELTAQIQEWYRQKNVALMVDLWLIALGKKCHKDGPAALRKLINHLGVYEQIGIHEQNLAQSEGSFADYLDRLCATYNGQSKSLALSGQPFQKAAQSFLEWLCAYEEKFAS